MIDLNFPKQPSVGFIKNGPKERKYSVGGISLGGNTLLIPEGRGEWLKLWDDNSNSNANNQVCRRASLHRQKTTPLLSDENRKLRHLVWKKHESNPRHKAHMISKWFLAHNDKFTALKWPPQSAVSVQWSSFTMWWNRRFPSWMCSREICSNCVMLSCQCLQHLVKSVLNLVKPSGNRVIRKKTRRNSLHQYVKVALISFFKTFIPGWMISLPQFWHVYH